MTSAEFKAEVQATLPDIRWKFLSSKKWSHTFRATLWVNRDPWLVIEYYCDQPNHPWAGQWGSSYRRGANLKRLLKSLATMNLKGIADTVRVLDRQQARIEEHRKQVTQDVARMQEFRSILTGN